MKEIHLFDLIELDQEKKRLEILSEKTRSILEGIKNVYSQSPEGKTASLLEESNTKYKLLEDENNRIKVLLKNQIEASDRLRLETQSTIETLKEEFDVLLKELTKNQRKEILNSAVGQSIQRKFSGVNGKLPEPLATSSSFNVNIKSQLTKLYQNL